MRSRFLSIFAVFHCVFLFAQFGEERIISTRTKQPYLAIPHDLNNDGFVDVITASYDTSLLSWYENLGNGNFGSEVILNETPVFYLSLHLTDLNQDGKTDILYHKNNPSEIAWLKALDNGGNFEEEEVLITPNGPFFRQMLPFDVDDDGFADILAIRTYSYYSDIVWYKNLGNGIFDSPILIYQHHDDLAQMVPADVDGDGLPDLLITDMVYEPATIFWLKNLGNGSFGEPLEIFQFRNLISHFTDIEDIQTADLNPDGKTDIVVKTYHDSSGYHLYQLENLDNEGNFGEPQLIKSGHSDFLLKDLNADGNPDILLWNAFDNTVSYKLNDGTGHFGEEVLITTEALFPEDAGVADLDNDGQPDVIVASRMDNKLAWFKNEMLSLDSYVIEQIKIFPNPVTDRLWVESISDVFKMELFNPLGVRVGFVERENFIDFSSLSGGVYLLKIFTSPSSYQSFKIIKE